MVNTQSDALFAGRDGRQERRFVRSLFAAARTHGFAQYHEPCVGSFATTLEAIAAGFPVEAIDTSDAHLFSAVIGTLATGRSLDTLGVTVGGKALPGDAGTILYELWRLRMEQHSDRPYWKELRQNAVEERDAHIAAFGRQAVDLAAQLTGIAYTPQDVRTHLARALDDDNSVIYCAPPLTRGAYDRLYDTGGRLRWNHPATDRFDGMRDIAKLIETADAGTALFLCAYTAPLGEAIGHPVYARALSGRRAVYISTNQPDAVEALIGVSAVPKAGSTAKKLPLPVIPRDHTVTADSALAVLPVDRATAYYYRDLWLHKLDFKLARFNFAVIVDGYVAGMSGYGTGPIVQTYGDDGDSLILTYAVGAPHRARLTRLITATAIQQQTVRTVLKPWIGLGCTKVVTVQLTPRPEAKEHRGTPFKLTDRTPDPTYGYKLTYVAPIQHDEWSTVIAAWARAEQVYQEKRSA